MTPKRPQNDPKRPPKHIETHLGPKKKNRNFSIFGSSRAPKSAKIEKSRKNREVWGTRNFSIFSYFGSISPNFQNFDMKPPLKERYYHFLTAGEVWSKNIFYKKYKTRKYEISSVRHHHHFSRIEVPS